MARRLAKKRIPRSPMKGKITPGSGNVFRDLGFPRREAARLQVRSELMSAIERIIDERKLTQAAAARLFGVTQPRISDLTRGRIDLFSIDGLVDMLSRASVAVEVRTMPTKSRRRGAA